jgi:hypothetical protein
VADFIAVRDSRQVMETTPWMKRYPSVPTRREFTLLAGGLELTAGRLAKALRPVVNLGKWHPLLEWRRRHDLRRATAAGATYVILPNTGTWVDTVRVLVLRRSRAVGFGRGEGEA